VKAASRLSLNVLRFKVIFASWSDC